MNLYILRHAIAAEPGTAGVTTDTARPLTSKGERRTWRATEAMAEMELEFDWILSSPLKRARQTADIVASAFECAKQVEVTEHLCPGGSTQHLVDLIKRHKPKLENVLLVGHEPYLSDLIALLVFGESLPGIVLRKGGLCMLSTETLKNERCASLEWLLTPKQLCAIG